MPIKKGKKAEKHKLEGELVDIKTEIAIAKYDSVSQSVKKHKKVKSRQII